MICNSRHRYIPVLDELEEKQAGTVRHKCAGCAYEQGMAHALNGEGRHLDVNDLKESQAGTGRHKDAQAAYNMGYEAGIQKRQ